MSKDVWLKLTVKPRFPEETLQASFPEEEWAQLQEFLRCSQELERTQLVSQGTPGLSFGFKIQGEGMIGFANLPHHDHVSALLHRLRPFLLQKERTNFGKVCNILDRRFAAEPMRVDICSIKQLYSGDGTQRLYTLSANDKIINSEDVFTKWLNAYEYHRDKEKQIELDELYSLIPPEIPKAIFISMLNYKSRAIVMVAFIILRMTEDNGAVAIDVR
jgi:hypothetical protein